MAVSLSRFPIGSGICDITYRLCTCGKYLPIPGCIRRLLAVPAVSSLGSPVKDTDIRWCYISSRPVYQVPFNVRQPQPKFFARCLVLVYFIYFPCVIKFSVLNIQKFFLSVHNKYINNWKNNDIHKFFFYLNSIFLVVHCLFSIRMAFPSPLAAFLPKKVFPSHFTQKKCVRGLIFE